jgi:heme/copper-type cytochrome/quinol oxidase subunit 2
MLIYDNIRTNLLTVHQKQLLRRYVVFRMVNIFILVFYIAIYFVRQFVASVSEKTVSLSHTPTTVRFIYDAGFH